MTICSLAGIVIAIDIPAVHAIDMQIHSIHTVCSFAHRRAMQSLAFYLPLVPSGTDAGSCLSVALSLSLQLGVPWLSAQLCCPGGVVGTVTRVNNLHHQPAT